MSDEPTKEGQQTPEETKAAETTTELSDQDLPNVAGGKVGLNDIHFTKNIDKSSPVLLL